MRPAPNSKLLAKLKAAKKKRPGSTAAPSSRSDWNRLVIGQLTGWDEAGRPLVDFPRNPANFPLPARSLLPLASGVRGSELALTFVDMDPRQPLILGVLQPIQAKGNLPLIIEMDGNRVEVAAKKEIVLRCGEASLTLTSAGKVLLRGTYILSRSSGVNSIKGGSVQIN